jgi:hypothetical protein
MTEAAIPPLERAQKLAGGAATFAVIAAILIAIGAAAQVVAAGWVEAVQEQQLRPDWRGALNLARHIATFAVLAIPSFLLVDALLGLSRVLDEFGKGQFFTLRASLGVRKAGESALWALAFKILISPTVFSWITHEGRGIVWHMEPFELGLIAFAAFVMVLGRVLEAAARIKEENDQIV